MNLETSYFRKKFLLSISWYKGACGGKEHSEVQPSAAHPQGEDVIGSPAPSASLIGFWQTRVPDLMRSEDTIAVCHCLLFHLGALTKWWLCSTKDSQWELQLAALKRLPYLISAGYFKCLSWCFTIHLSTCHLVSILLLRCIMSSLIKTQKNGCNRWFSRLCWTMSLRESSFCSK